MKMFLTRMGDHSKIIVTGDLSQIDLPHHQTSGLLDAVRVLEKVDGIAIQHLNRDDIVRHEVVQRIVKAYGQVEEKRRQADAAAKVSRQDRKGSSS